MVLKFVYSCVNDMIQEHVPYKMITSNIVI